MGCVGKVLKRFVVAMAFLIAIWLLLVAYVHYVGLKEWKRLTAAWVTDKEIRHLMRYHGTDMLKITQDRVYIWRESRWIPVRKRPEG